MQIGRLSIRAVAVVLCLVWGVQATAQGSAAAYRAAVDKKFNEWLSSLKLDAAAKGISPKTFDMAMKGVKLDWSLPDLEPPDLGEGQPARPRAEKSNRQKQQAEFDRPGRYFPQKGLTYVTKLGREQKARWKDTLKAIEEKFGVEGHVVLAIWGRETAFGRAKIPHYAVQALATQAFMGRRQEKFREELFLALGILQEGHVTRSAMRSSWAGAMGHTQFLPSDFRNYAVDFNGDGRRDIWGTIPDALASTANYLRRAGWTRGGSWMIEVKVADSYRGPQGRKRRAALSTWAQRGVVRADGTQLSGGARAGLLLPAGPRGPGFLVFGNFDALYAYNQAESYALAISHLADRIAGYPDLRTAWPTDDPGLTRAQRMELQRLLAKRGYYEGEIDGRFGPETRAAMKKAQVDLGLPVTARAGMKFYKALAAQ